MIIALAGRRVDAINAEEVRFPLHNVERVSNNVGALLEEHSATAVVCSAACGADLIALREAGKLGLQRRVVLPYSREKFREGSVVDRPGDWGELYDSILDEVDEKGGLVILNLAKDDEAYSATNRAILDEAVSLGMKCSETVGATLVWDGSSRGKNDYTEEFGSEARKRGLPTYEVPTL